MRVAGGRVGERNAGRVRVRVRRGGQQSVEEVEQQVEAEAVAMAAIAERVKVAPLRLRRRRRHSSGSASSLWQQRCSPWGSHTCSQWCSIAVPVAFSGSSETSSKRF
jgi:hypothetical protein